MGAYAGDGVCVGNYPDGDAPEGFNEEEVLEISRRIELDAGSNYSINGKDVRIAAWNSTTREGKEYLSIKVSEKTQDLESDVHQPAKVNQDEIPF